MIKLQSIEQFKELKKKHTVFLFSAKWCPDCRVIEPFLNELETIYSNMEFVYVDRDEFIDLCIENNIYGIPSFLVFNEDELLGSFVSKFRKTKQEIIDFLETVK
ncbi:thioredoxin family protein [Mycoplasmatota bacterium]|nr:thioredoxin family protein [Mycoplasmatota bacterium]